MPIRRRIELSWRGPYRKLWLLIGSLIVAVGIGYAIGTKVAVNALFNTWLIVWFFPAGIIPMFQYRNFRQYGAMPAFVTMVTYMLLLFVLGGMVFGNPCPYVHLPQFGTPGAR